MLRALERLGDGLRRRTEIPAARLWLRTQGAAARRDLVDVRTYCMFVGHPRSGHSLVGSLLNAHPDAVIAHELDALKYVQRGIARDDLFLLLLRRDRQFARGGRRWTGYDYAVPDGWQGRHRRLRVVGDKKGGRSALRIAEDPTLLTRLLSVVGVPVVLIQVVRNPYDNVATMCGRTGDGVDEAIATYRTMCVGVQRAVGVVGTARTVVVHYDDFVADPGATLATLWRSLGLEAPPDLLEACARVVFSAPSRTRDRIRWTPGQIGELEACIARFPFLARYAGSLERDAAV